MFRNWFVSVLSMAVVTIGVSLSIAPRALGEDATSTPAATPAAASAATTVVATVDGEDVFLSDVEAMVASLSAQYPSAPRDELERQVVQRLIERKLIVRAALAAGLDQDPGVQKRLAELRDDVLQEVYLTRQVDKDVTESKLRAAYKQLTSKLAGEEEVHARHILVEDQAAAKALITELKGGADFAKLAKEHSTGPSSKRGGDLGFFRKEAMVPPFSKAAFALKTGAFTTEPVKTRFGWHVIKVEDRRPVSVPSYEDSVEQLRGTEAQLVVNRVLDRLNEAANIQVFEDKLPSDHKSSSDHK